MKTFRITYRQEVLVCAETLVDAQEIFAGLNLDDLQNELGNGIIKSSSFIEETDIDEI
jgi:hypothetical protein